MKEEKLKWNMKRKYGKKNKCKQLKERHYNSNNKEKMKKID